jgi:hypothetical protein
MARKYNSTIEVDTNDAGDVVITSIRDEVALVTITLSPDEARILASMIRRAAKDAEKDATL